jgi:hypothetical protein
METLPKGSIRNYRVILGYLQIAFLVVACWIFVTDPGWIEVGKADWRWPCALGSAMIGGILLPGIALFFTVRRRETQATSIFWAIDLTGFAALLIWGMQYG